MDQSTALSILKSGRNVFLTGQAGSGKTYVINQYVRYLRACGVKVALTASTGIAATHIGGTTIHSRSGVGIRESLSDYDIDLLTQKEYLHRNMNDPAVLVIDEISMLSAQTLDMINRVVQEVRGNREPFGGLQVVMCGDFFQLPPVQKFWGSDTKRFAFAAKVRKELDLAICYLDTQHRQTDSTFTTILNELRTGTPSEATIAKLQSRITKAVKNDRVKLYTHNVDVDRINFDELMALDAQEEIFTMQTKGKKKHVETLKKSMLIVPTLRLKLGAKVIFVKNNTAKWYRNGSTGTVTDFDKSTGYPIVTLMDGRKVKAEPEVRTIEDGDELLASVEQIPLKLARAITVHKSQGMTLDAAQIDLGKSFEAGQAYVALSRLRSLDGLALLGLNISGLNAHELVVRGDAYFQQQSNNLEKTALKPGSNEAEHAYERFIKRCGGIYKPDAHDDSMPKKEKMLKPTKKPKGDTLIETMTLIQEGKKLDEIAQIRWLAMSTVFQHLMKIKSQYPKVGIAHLKPSTDQIKLVTAAIKKAKHDKANFDTKGNLLLKPLYLLLQEHNLTYEQIRLCLLFIK